MNLSNYRRKELENLLKATLVLPVAK